MRLILFFFVLSFFFACGGAVNSGAVAKLDGYQTEIVPGTNITKAIKKDNAGDIIEMGYVSNGKRNGTWLTFYQAENAGKIKSIASYSDGILSGPYLELSNRGQVETEVYYENNMYNGRFASYKFGRMEKEMHYVNNQLDGKVIEYNNRGEIQKEINYKDGKQHGLMRYYNDEGEVIVEYEYKDGEKISGGMVGKE